MELLLHLSATTLSLPEGPAHDPTHDPRRPASLVLDACALGSEYLSEFLERHLQHQCEESGSVAVSEDGGTDGGSHSRAAVSEVTRMVTSEPDAWGVASDEEANEEADAHARAAAQSDDSASESGGTAEASGGAWSDEDEDARFLLEEPPDW